MSGEEKGSFQPRQHDHLVEPMFAGLGVGSDEIDAGDLEQTGERGAAPACAPLAREAPEHPGFWTRLLKRLGLRRARASRPEDGR